MRVRASRSSLFMPWTVPRHTCPVKHKGHFVSVRTRRPSRTWTFTGDFVTIWPSLGGRSPTAPERGVWSRWSFFSGPLGPRPEEKLVLDRAQPPDDRVQQQELTAIVQQALETLNERQRVAVVLNKFEDMSYAEIAEIMELTPKAVKSLLS